MATALRPRCAAAGCGRPALIEDTLCLGHHNDATRRAAIDEILDDILEESPYTYFVGPACFTMNVGDDIVPLLASEGLAHRVFVYYCSAEHFARETGEAVFRIVHNRHGIVTRFEKIAD